MQEPTPASSHSRVALGGRDWHIYALEPTDREHRRLLDSLKLSNVRNVTPIHAAVGETPGRGRLIVADSQFSGLNTLGGAFRVPRHRRNSS